MSHHQKESKRSPAFISPAKLDLMKKALKQLRAGKMIIVVDDEERENEGDLIMSGEKINARAINFMAKEGRGLICAPVSIEICKKLELYPMAKKIPRLLGPTLRFPWIIVMEPAPAYLLRTERKQLKL